VLDPAGWLAAAQELDEGKSQRLGHDCGLGDTLIVNHKPTGWAAYCHRCADKGWVPKPLPSLAEKAQRRAAQAAAERAVEADPRPPYPADFNVAGWPLAARVWLYKAALFDRDIADLGAYYNERLNRVILPVVEDGRVVYWQARSITGDGPKYLNPRVDRSSLVACYGEDDVIVLTEDILSAYRVGQVSQGWSLLGTKITTPVLARLLAEGKPVLVWLDDDHGRQFGNPGQAAAGKIMRSLTNVGIVCHKIVTSKDPKLLSRAEIKEVLAACRSTLRLSV